MYILQYDVKGRIREEKKKKQLVLSTVVALYRGWMMDKYDKMEKIENMCVKRSKTR